MPIFVEDRLRLGNISKLYCARLHYLSKNKSLMI